MNLSQSALQPYSSWLNLLLDKRQLTLKQMLNFIQEGKRLVCQAKASERDVVEAAQHKGLEVSLTWVERMPPSRSSFLVSRHGTLSDYLPIEGLLSLMEEIQAKDASGNYRSWRWDEFKQEDLAFVLNEIPISFLFDDKVLTTYGMTRHSDVALLDFARSLALGYPMNAIFVCPEAELASYLQL